MTMLTMMAFIFHRRIDKVCDSRKFRMNQDDEEEEEERIRSFSWETLADVLHCFCCWPCRRFRAALECIWKARCCPQEEKQPKPWDEWGECDW